MKWLILNHPLTGRKTLKIEEEDDVDKIIKNNPACEVVDIAVSEGDKNE